MYIHEPKQYQLKLELENIRIQKIALKTLVLFSHTIKLTKI